MPWQLVYTSAPRTLKAGQSGYGTVARSLDLREALVQRLEQLSYFDHGEAGSGAMVACHRVLELRGTRYHVLSRIVDAGLDFTGRTNHLAHHVILAPSDLEALPGPATVLRHWNGWRSRWAEPPRYLDDADWGDWNGLVRFRTDLLPARAWLRTTGDAGRAAALVHGSPTPVVTLRVEAGGDGELLDLFAESLELLGAGRWEVPFTTASQTQDLPGDFVWRGISSTRAAAGPQRNLIASAVAPADLPVPEGELARMARRGPEASAPARLAPGGLVAPDPSGPAAPTSVRLASRVGTPEVVRAGVAADPLEGGGFGEAPRRGQLRFWIGLLGLVGVAWLITGGFYYPGWFVPRGRPVPVAQVTTSAGAGAEGNGILVQPPSAPRVGGTTPGATVAGADGEAPWDAGEAARSVIEGAYDAVPTYLVLSRKVEGEGHAVDAGAIPELVALLEGIFGTKPFLDEKRILVHARAGDLRGTDAASGPAGHPAIQEHGAKRVSMRTTGAGEPLMQLDATRWLAERTAPVQLQVASSVDRGGGFVLRPADPASAGSFGPFRLQVQQGPPPRPLELPRSLVRSGRARFEDALHPELLKRLPRLVPRDGFQYRLWPLVGSPATNLFEPAGEYQPPEGGELAFDAARAEIEERLEARAQEVGRLEEQVARLGAEVAAATTNDLPLGLVFGIQPRGREGKPTREAHLASLPEFHRKSGGGGADGPPDRAQFVAYLKALTDHFKLPGRALLESRSGLPVGVRELGHLQEQWNAAFRARPDIQARWSETYLTNRWAKFGTLDLLKQLKEQSGREQARVRRLQALLERLPRTDGELPQVALRVVDARGAFRLELIRFTDTLSEPAP